MSYSGKFKDKNNNLHPVTSVLYGTCDTAAATAAKVVTCSDFDTLMTGVTIRVKFANANTAASPTVNINSTGAKSVYRFGSTDPVDGNSWNAGEVVELVYDGTSFFMTGADDIAAKQNATDNSLQTTDKTVVGAINEHEGDIGSLKSGLTNLDNEVNGDTTYPYADVITIPDAVPANVADCSVKIEPVQDLHGYDKPWVGGAGKNKLPLTVDGIKAANTTGTWTGNVYVLGDLTFEILTDESGVNVNGIKVSGTNGNSIAYFKVGSFVGDGTSYILNGCPENGSTSTYNAFIEFTSASFDNGSGVTFNDSGAGNVYIRINSQYVIPTGGLTFYPMIRLATETDATFAPYTNYCPITGHTEASVQRDGVNLFDPDHYETFDLTGEGVTLRYGHQYGANTYTIINNGSNMWYYRVPTKDLSDRGTTQNIAAGSSATVTVDSSHILWVFCQNWATDSPDDICVRIGNTTAYEPYEGQQYTIALGDTIYGGTVDFNTGVMTVTKKYIEYDGSNDEEWIYYDLRNCYSIPRPSDSGRDLYAETNQFKHGALYSTTAGEFYFGNDNLNINSVPMFATLSDWITHLSNNPLQLCYELATPFTIQLTPAQIQLLKGTNTLTASTGQISVTVNGVSGSIGAVQRSVNELAGNVVNIATAVATKADYRKYSISKNTSSYTISDLSDIFMSILAVSIPPGYSDAVNGLYVLCRQGNTLLLTPLHETTSTLGLTATLTDGNIVFAWTVTNNYGGSLALIDLYKNQ